MSKEINIGIIGLGTIGGGVVSLLKENRSYIREFSGVDIRLRKVCDLDITTDRGLGLRDEELTTDADELINSEDIDVIVELIGGISPADDFITRSLKSGKDVVTANKALIATEGIKLFNIAKGAKRTISFEAAVGGGIPILHSLSQSLNANKIESIFGIVNGTCNFILTEMRDEELDFESALKLAQQKGFAEAKPALDIEGIDSAHKLAILSTLAFGKYISLNDVYVEGIREISNIDIEFAQRLGYTIKLLVIAKRINKEIEVRVHPTMIPQNTQVGKTEGVYNAIEITGNFVKNVLFYGRGAGALPTASAIVSDIISIAKNENTDKIPIGYDTDRQTGEMKLSIKNILDIEMRYYMRIKTKDKPGVLAMISKILAEKNISIASVEQLETYLKEKSAVIVIITHKAKENNMNLALDKVNGLDDVLQPVNLIRIEDIK